MYGLHDLYAHCITAKVSGVTVHANYLLDITGADVPGNRAHIASSALGATIDCSGPLQALRRNAEFRYNHIQAARVPAIFTYRQFVREGALIAYGPDTTDIFQLVLYQTAVRSAWHNFRGPPVS